MAVHSSSSAQQLRWIAAGCLGLGSLLFSAMLYCAVDAPSEEGKSIPYFVEGIVFAMVGGGIFVLLRAMATLLEARTDSTYLTDSLSEISQHLRHLKSVVKEANSPAVALSPTDAAVVARIESSLEEIREFTLMTEAEREQRLGKVVEQRKRQLANEVIELIGKQEWARAEHLVTTLETHFPNDPYSAGCRRDLNIARNAAEYEAIIETQRRIEGLVMMENYDNALVASTKLVENFPSNAEARSLLQRVTREREIHIDASGQKLYEDIRVEIDRRDWKSAETLAHRMLTRYPNHVRAMQVRDQFDTIQDNAEIQERQEIEVQIEELIRTNRYSEAIGLGEDLIRRFPSSPQARTLQNAMLPRLRELLQQEGQPAL